MARKDLEPAERDRVPLTIEELVECPRCFTLFDEVFLAPLQVSSRPKTWRTRSPS